MPVMGLGCCLWLLGAGALAVWLYQRRIPGSFVTPGMGMRIGAVAGGIGFFANALWMALRFTANSQELRKAMQEAFDKSISANPDPRAQEVMRQFMGNLSTPQGFATFFVLILAVMGVAFVIFGAAGGALGESRLPAAYEILKEKWSRTVGMPGKKVLLASMAASKLDGAIAFLVSLIETEGIPTAAAVVEALSIYSRNERVRKSVNDAVLTRSDQTLVNQVRRDFESPE